METANLVISGMNSAASLRSVQSALSVIHGVSGVGISLDDGKATVNYDADKVLPRQFQVAVRVMGCEIESITLDAPGFMQSGSRSNDPEQGGIGPASRVPFRGEGQ